MLQLLSMVFVALSLLATPSTVSAQDAHIIKARDSIAQLGDKAQNIVQSKEELGYEASKVKFREMVAKNFDVNTIARFTLGRYWRAATAEEQKEFTGLVQDAILDKYADRILEYNGERFTTTDARAVNDKDAIVNMTVKPEGNPETIFAWRVRNFNGEYRVIDLSIEGISMSVTHRNDFSSIIQRNGGQIEPLLALLRSKKE